MVKKLIPAFRLFFILALLLSQVQMALATDTGQSTQPGTARVDSASPGEEPVPADTVPDPSTDSLPARQAGDCALGVVGQVVLPNSGPPPNGVPNTTPPYYGYTTDTANPHVVGDTITIMVVISNTSAVGCTPTTLTNVSGHATIWGSDTNSITPPGSGTTTIDATLVWPAGNPPQQLNAGQQAYGFISYVIPDTFSNSILHVRTTGSSLAGATPHNDLDNLTYTDYGTNQGISIVGPGIVLDPSPFIRVGPNTPVNGNEDTTFTITVRSTRAVAINSLSFAPDDPNPATPLVNEFQAAATACGTNAGWTAPFPLPATPVGATSSCTFTVKSP